MMRVVGAPSDALSSYGFLPVAFGRAAERSSGPRPARDHPAVSSVARPERAHGKQWKLISCFSVGTGVQSCSEGPADHPGGGELEEEDPACVPTEDNDACVDINVHANSSNESRTCTAVANVQAPEPAVSSFDGLLLTSVAVLAGILGRLSAQELRYDASRLFRNQESSRSLNVELRRKRQEWKEQEEVRLAVEQKRRVEEVTEKARKEAARQKKIQEKLEKEAREEQERRKKEIEASRREYEELQQKLDEEYKERLRKEQIALEEARRLEAERREQEERKRLEELARQEEEQKRQELLAEQARQEAADARKRKKEEAEKQMSKFAVRIEGSISIKVPPTGSVLPGPLQEMAKARMTAQATSLLGGPSDVFEQDYASVADCVSSAPAILSSAVKQASGNLMSALQFQKMRGEGPLMLMEPPEVESWINMATMRSVLSGLDGLDLVKSEQKDILFEKAFECRTESGILPPDHPLSFQQVYEQLLDKIIENQNNSDTIFVFMESMNEENEKFYKGLSQSPGWPTGSSSPQNLGLCLALAHFIDRALYARPAKESGAPAWFEQCVEFCRQRMSESFVGAAPDSLGTHAVLLSQVLAEDHPIALEMARIADLNVSQEQKIALKEKDRARKALLAAKLLEEEWPDEAELRKARAKEREAKTPVTERIWALKNVASSLALGNLGEVARARQLLEQAVLLKQDMCGSSDHPAVFPEALSLLKVIRGRDEWSKDASGVAVLFLRIVMNISQGYVEAGDFLSACIVLELGLREAEDAAGLRNTVTLRCVKSLEKISARLKPEEVACMGESRSHSAEIENFLVEGFTDELGAYRKDGTERTRRERWDEEGPGLLGKIRV